MTAPFKPPRRELREKDFIQDDAPKNPFPYWIWGALLTALIAILWGSNTWYSGFIRKEVAESPFLQVTNRQMSIFLWQFPQYMRINTRSKSGYLTGFNYDQNVSILPGEAEKFVEAPPDLIFLYHTWNRLISREFSARPIPSNEFQEFLNYSQEWKPENWPKAPLSYVTLVRSLGKSPSIQDFNVLPLMEFPLEVKQAFQGWKNYIKEGVEINSLNPTYENIEQFLQSHPHYARNFWRNVEEEDYPNYIKSLGKEKKGIVPKDEIAPFLLVAVYNFLEAQKKK